MIRVLAVDTATEACSVALWRDGEVRERYAVAGREHSTRLLPMLHELLAECGCALAQIDGFVCSAGPGSFAGLRIGLGLVKGLALGLDRPAVAVSTLAVLAQRPMRLAGATRVLPAVDARMNEVYFGAYERDAGGLARPVQPDVVSPPEAVSAPGENGWLAVGTGWRSYGDRLRKAVGTLLAGMEPDALPHAEEALWLGVPDLRAGRGVSADQLMPVYLRDRVALTLVEQETARRREPSLPLQGRGPK